MIIQHIILQIQQLKNI